MKQRTNIIEFNKELAFDDIVCILHPVHSCDLKQILMMTPEDKRLEVAISFSGITIKELVIKSGLYDGNDKTSVCWKRWLNHENKLPLGAAFRLAKVLGVPVEVLFASPKWKKE